MGRFDGFVVKEFDAMDFDAWMEEVDAAVSAKCGLSVYDLADRPFYDMYEDEYTPEEAAKDALEYEGFPF